MISKKKREEGRFFTPMPWVHHCHPYMESVYGNDWKEKYNVWDNSCGHCNLTKDYTFNNLFSSTLLQSDIDYINDNNINQNATNFQFDFLNDGFNPWIGKELPKGLQDIFINKKPLIIFINPPFGTSSSGLNAKCKTTIKETQMKKYLKTHKLGSCTRDVLTHFLARITMLKKQYKHNDLHLAMFSTPGFITGVSFKKFREEFMPIFKYRKGFIFEAKEFPGVTSDWAMLFTIWQSCNREKWPDDFALKYYVRNKNNDIKHKGWIYYRNLDHKETSKDWINEEKVDVEKEYFPRMVKLGRLDDQGHPLKVEKNFLGIYSLIRPQINKNMILPLIYSTPYTIENYVEAFNNNNIFKLYSLFTTTVNVGLYNNWYTQYYQLSKPTTKEKEYFPRMTKMGVLDDKGYELKVEKNFLGFCGVQSSSISWNMHIPMLLNVPYHNSGNLTVCYNNINKIVSIFTTKLLMMNNEHYIWYTQNYQLSKPTTKEKEYFPRMTKMGVLDDKGYELKVEKGFLGIYNRSFSKIDIDIGLALLLSTPYNRGHSGISIQYTNIIKIISVFTSKMLISSQLENSWFTKDYQLSKPKPLTLLQQYIYDSIVYSIFNNRCRTYSMRQYPYKGKNWDVKNEFFWLTREFMKRLALTEDFYPKLYNDACDQEERYIAKILYGYDENGENIFEKLSPDAREVLLLATDLVVRTFKYRKEYEKDNCWTYDAGYEQLKKIWKEKENGRFIKFRKKYEQLGDRMRHLVYKLGFLGREAVIYKEEE